MDLRRFFEIGDCGQANPLAQLATHVTQDQARQDTVSTGCTNENLMLPNTFNMNELAVQMQSLQSLPGPSNNSIGRPMQSLESLPAGPSFRDNAVYNNFYPPQEQMTRCMNVAGNQVPAYFPFLYFDAATKELDEYVDMPESEAEVESASCSLEYYSRTELTSAEAEKFQELQKQLPEDKDTVYLHYDGVFVKDVYGVSKLGMEFNDFEYYEKFVENYVLAKSSVEYQKYQPTVEEQHVIEVSVETDETTVIKYDKFEFKIPKEKPVLIRDPYIFLFDRLVKAEQHYHAIKVANAIIFDSKCIPDDLIFLLTNLYLHEHCFYQACQTLFTWLKNHPKYGDIVPPYFSMEDKSDTAVDKELLKDLQRMFIKAVQRSPIEVDIRVQTALAKLCFIDKDHEKSVDCYRTIVYKPPCWFTANNALMSLGNSLALANKPKGAILSYSLLRKERLFAPYAITNLGLMHLYMKNYKAAFKYLFEVLKTHLAEYKAPQDLSLENAWTRLRLCCELMRRDDLCEAIDNRDYSKLNEVTFEK